MNEQEVLKAFKKYAIEINNKEQCINELKQQLAEKDKELDYFKQVLGNWQKEYKNLSSEKSKAVLDYDYLIRNVNKFADKQLAIKKLEEVNNWCLESNNVSYYLFLEISSFIDEQIEELNKK